MKTKVVRCFSPSCQWIIAAEQHRRPKYSIENHGLATLFAELSVENEGVGDAAAEAFA